MICNFLVLLFALGMAPKIIWQVWRKNKRVPSVRDRLGYPAPQEPIGEGRRVWIHAVSLGEMKAAKALIDQLFLGNPQLNVLLTSATATGIEEAHRQFSLRCTIRYFPLDFSSIMRRWLKAFHPEQIIFVEGDVWPNLVREAKRLGIRTALVSGKISEKSTKRFRFFRSFSRRLLGSLDILAVQNEEHRDRFATLVDCPIHITGNLKLDVQSAPIDSEMIRKRFALLPDQPVITIACTHAPEEYELLNQFRLIWNRIPNVAIFLAPRHPERFQEVASILTQMKIPFCHWNQDRSQELVILVDVMGQLPACYSISRLTIVAGSFSSHKGGHNVTEPCMYGCPVLFGPSMHAQKEFAKMIIQSGAGQEVTIENLAQIVFEWLRSAAHLRANALRFIEQNRGSSRRTVELLQRFHP